MSSKVLDFPSILVEEKDVGKVTMINLRFLDKLLHLLLTFGY